MFKRNASRASSSPSLTAGSSSASSSPSTSTWTNGGTFLQQPENHKYPNDSIQNASSNSLPRRGGRGNNNARSNAAHINNNYNSRKSLKLLHHVNAMNVPLVVGDDLCSGFESQNWRKDRCKKCFRLKDQHGAAAPQVVQPIGKVSATAASTSLSKFKRQTSANAGSDSSVSAVSSNVSSWRQRFTGAQPPPLKKAQSDVGPVLSSARSNAGGVATSSGDSASSSKESSPSPVPPQRRTKFVILKAEVSVDGNDVEEVTMPTVLPVESAPRSASPANFSINNSSTIADYDTAHSNEDPMSRTVSFESVASTLMDNSSMVTAEYGAPLSERSSTPTESLDETRAFVRSIRAQLEIMENKCAKLEEENMNLKRMSPTPAGASSTTGATDFNEKLNAAENLCQDYRDENIVLKCELRDLQESVSRHMDPEKKTLRDKLTAAEQLCEELMDENETLKTDTHAMQREIDEMRDQYREEEIDEFRDLQRELEQTAKNCRILQFKLRKADRRNDQCEADRQHLEEKLKEMLSHSGGFDPSESPRLRELESELRIAKEVSVRLHNELEMVDEKRCKLEDENFYFREKIREIETREKIEQGRAKYEQKKTSGLARNFGANSNSKESTAAHNGVEYNVGQLLRDLQDACERETDLRDQLKFAENDIQAARKKLSDLETENEGLMRQVSKFTAPGAKSGKPMMKRSYSEGHAQIELELAEHEAQTLKSKLDKMEKENECMMSRISLLEKEARKIGGRTEFSSDELRSAIPDTYYKQKIKMLEEELEEWKIKFETMQKPEADQDTVVALKLSGKLASARSSAGRFDQNASVRDVDLKRKLEIVEQEAGVLRQRIASLEMENERPRLNGFVLTGENKRLSFPKKSGKTSASDSVEFESNNKMKEKIDQMEKDIHRFINRIAELEKEKESLTKEVERRKKLESIKKEATSVTSVVVSKFNPQTATLSELRDKVQDLTKENASFASNLKAEQTKLGDLETQLSDYKQIISMSENQKLITMASKVEVLTNQLKEAQNRFENMHRRFAGLPNNSVTGKKYEDALKERVETLEKILAEERAKIKSTQITKDASKMLASPDTDEDVGSVELSQCNQVLATVEDQVDRIYKQVEQLEAQQKSTNISPIASPALSRLKVTASTNLEPPSLAAGEKEKLLKDIVSMKSELQTLKSKLKDRRKEEQTLKLDAAQLIQEDFPANVSIKLLQKKCQQQERLIGELKEQLEVSKQERMSAYHECETATARLLQTEDRWNKELEKLKESYENQVKDLKYYLQEAERVKDEKSTLLQERTALLQDKNKRLTDVETKAQKLEQDLKTKHKDLQDKLDTEKKKAKEFETKYQKLETLYESDRQKLNTEKDKFKQDLSDMRKKYDETQQDFEKLKYTYDRKEQLWAKDKQELEGKIKLLQDDVKEVEKKAAKKASEMSSVENKKLLASLDDLKKKLETEQDEWKADKTIITNELEQKAKVLEQKLSDLDKMKKEVDLMKSRINDQKQQLEETRKVRDEAREELSRWQQTWARERSELAHKLRQEEKVQQAEHQALQLKYESRIKVMEDSSKRLQSQLTQTRRERDQFRESLVTTEKKVAELRQKFENEEKETQQRLSKLEQQSVKAEDLGIQLEKERLEMKTLKKTYETDKRLWCIEKEQFSNKIKDLEKGTFAATSAYRPGRSLVTSQSSASLENVHKDKLVEESMQVANQLRLQVDEMKTAYDQDVNNLRKQIDNSRVEWNKEKLELQKKLKDLQENIKVLEIDRRNMLSTKDQNESDKSQLQSDRDTLMEKLHDSEIHQLANKYKLDKVADQLTDLQAKVRYGDLSNNEKRDMQDIVKKALEQLVSVREDMGKTKELGKALESIEVADAGDVASLNSWKSGNNSRLASTTDIDSTDRDSVEGNLSTKERLAPIGSEAETLSTKSAPPGTVKKPTDAVLNLPPMGHAPTFQSSKPMLVTKSVSVSSDLGFEARIAEYRLRSPSPSPRKITNYPEPPPSMIFNVKHAVEYDSEGRRHWTRRSQIKRSTSLDPNPANLAVAENSDIEDAQSAASFLRSSSVDHRVEETPSLIDSDTKTEKSSITSQSPSTKRRVIDIFATLRKSTSKEGRRKIFGERKATSIESSDIGHTIGVMGVQVLPPAVTPSTLPDPLQKSKKFDELPKLSKSTSGSRILDRIRGRSSSRDKMPKQTDFASGISDESSADGCQSIPVTILPGSSVSAVKTATELGAKSRTSSDENAAIPKGTSSSSTSYARTSYSSSSASATTASTTPYTPSYSAYSSSSRTSRSPSAFQRLSTSYSNVRSIGSKYLHRS